MTEEQTKKLNEIRDGLALWYIKGLPHFNNIKKVETDDVFRDGFTAAVKHLEPLVKVLKHPDIDELPCECGHYEAGKYHECIKCAAKSALKKVFGE